jgi:hypothetical protein
MKKKKTIKRKASKTVENVPTYNPYGAMHGLTLGALSERVDTLEEEVELLMQVVDMLVSDKLKHGVLSTTYMANSPSR